MNLYSCITKTIIAFIISAFFAFSINAQTASPNEGCRSLEVSYLPPDGYKSADGYTGPWFWDFKTGATSTLEEPSNTFTNAGEYEVEFWDGAGNSMIGTVTVKVYNKPSLDSLTFITSKNGCVPHQVEMEANPDLPGSVTANSYSWDFGDGTAGNGQNVTNTYSNVGTYNVTVELQTNLQSCNQTYTFSQAIKVDEQPVASFSTTPSPATACEGPLDVSFTNNSTSPVDLEYDWDFGNGNTSSDQNPPTQTYTEDDNYTVTLTITDIYGCESTSSTTVTIGNPTADFEIPDTLCLGVRLDTLKNKSIGATSYFWNFGGAANNSTSFEPNVTFNTPGDFTVTLTSTAAGCSDDISKDIYVQDFQVSYVSDPTYSCNSPDDFEFDGTSNYSTASWEWIFGDDSIASGQNVIHTYDVGDSTYTERGRNIFITELTAISTAGCIATYSSQDTIHLPWARFMPDISEGCAPLTVTFSDSSRSNEDIAFWRWDYDDGSTNTFTDDDDHSHTFTSAGKYQVTLIIENDLGCIDTSHVINILVGEPLAIDFDASSYSVCPGEEIDFTNLTSEANADLISSWNYSSDNNPLSHCYSEDEPTLSFTNEVGMQSITLTVEYNGCYFDVTKNDFIEVLGPIANFTAKQNCETPFDVEFENLSGGATSVEWDFDNGDIDTEDAVPFTYTYPAPGDYEVILTASNGGTGCPDDKDTLQLYIRDLEAVFTLDSTTFCGEVAYEFDASASTGVNASCYRGYSWVFSDPDIRPYTTAEQQSDLTFVASGDQTISLVVEDINGCRDTLTQEIRVFNMEVEFDISRNLICFPDTLQFTNQTTADTLIASYSWVFGDDNNSNVENPEHIYNSGAQPGGFLNASLTIEDYLGCSSNISKRIDVYKPTSTITSSNNVCSNDEVTFSALDYNDQGSHLLFDWDMGDEIGESVEQSFSYVFQGEGSYNVKLIYEEAASGCKDSINQTINVQNYPEALYTTNVDGQTVLCYPQIINFNDESSAVGDISPITGNTWLLGEDIVLNNSPSAVTTFDKGEHEVSLIVRTSFGCNDTLTREFLVVGPEGDFTMSRDTVCQGDEIEFTLIDAVDIDSLVWDFGDGNTQINETPTTHEYHFIPPSGQTIAILTIFGEGGVCATSHEKPVYIREVISDFVINDSIDTIACLNELFLFTNTSQNADIFSWDLGDDSTTSTATDFFEHSYSETGVYEVRLMVESSTLGCRDTTMKEVIVYAPIPVLAIGDSVCYGDEATIKVENPTQTFDYSWSPPGELFTPDSSSTQLVATSSEFYSVESIDSNGCVAYDSAFVYVVPVIESFDFDTSIVVGDSAILPFTFSSEIVFEWTPEEGLSCTDCPNPKVGDLEDMFYTVYMEDIYGCSEGTSTYTIRIIPETFIDLPTTFTPNGDGVNDIIYVKGWGIKNLIYFKIFNRWGDMVFETDDINEGWNGYYNGVLQNNDIYVYIVKVETWRDEELQQEGHINLMR